jgi:hypothetical protein
MVGAGEGGPMSLVNATRFEAIDVPWVDETGREVVIAIIKATFELDPQRRVVPSEVPSPVRLADEAHDPDAENGSLRYPSDVCARKVGTDVVVIGDAVSARPVAVVDVAIGVREAVAPLRVHGERLFYKHSLGLAIGPAAPFERKPLIYERAFGGSSRSFGVVELRNPAGVGVADDDDELDGTRAPQIEHPSRPHTRSSDRHAPMGSGAIPPHWEPRRTHAGTFDASWREGRMPLLPLDYHPRHANVAHPSLIFERHLAAGDPVSVLGMRLDGLFRFEIPRFAVVFRALFDGADEEVRPPIDTVLVEPDRGRFELVARATFPTGRGKKILREIRIDTEET